MSEQSPGVGIRDGSASAQFLRVLQGAVDAFPKAFDGFTLPDSTGAFRERYFEVLPAFEARRQRSPDRTQIAAHLAAGSQDAHTFFDGTAERPLQEAVSQEAAPYPLTTQPGSNASGPLLSVPVQGERLQGAALQGWLDALLADHKVTAAAHRSLKAITARPGLDLSGRRVVILGAGAALAPVALLRQAGASVLWIDLKAPDPAAVPGAGTLSFVASGADLLREPHRIRATMLAFAEGCPLDVCLFAYAPGKGREWRLTAAMNAIVSSLPAEQVRTVSMFVSPSIPTRMGPDDLESARSRRQARPFWQGLVERLGMLGRGDGHVVDGDVAISRSVLSTQGVSYQAAQYLGKAMAAEAWATQAAPLHVSANTAPVSLTPSLDKPFFRLAFHGARVFGIEAFAPATTRHTNGLLMVGDWLSPDAPGNPARRFETPQARAEAIQAVRVHGGAHGIVNPAEPAMRVSFLAGVLWPWGQRL